MIKVKENGRRLGIDFWGNKLVELESCTKKKDLTDVEFMALRYAAMELVAEGNGFDLTRDQVDNEASFQDEELYVGNFEGYESDMEYGLSLRSVYFTTDNRIVADFEDIETDDIISFLVY